MAKRTFELIHGLEIGSDIHKIVEMRDVTAGDLIKADEDSEQAYVTPRGTVVLSSPTRAMVILLCRVISKIGTISPVCEQELNKLNVEDFEQLQQIYLEMRGVGNLAEMGRDSEPL